jgi:internalin A
MPERPSPQSWRRLLRLSVRSLMVLVLIAGGGLGWVIHRANVQRDAVAAIKRAGGDIAYSWQWSNGSPVFPIPKPPWPDWVRRSLGPDFLDTVTYVRLHGEKCDDDSLCAASRLPWLEELTVVNTSVTDASAEDLRQLRNLRSLDLRLNRITSRPLRHIGEMSELRELTLSMKLFAIPADDEDMAFLKRLTKLERLNLWSANLNDSWLVYLERLASLKSLQLSDTAMTAEGLDHLKGLPNLTAVLTVNGTRFTLTRPNAADADIAEREDMLRRIRLIRGNK